MIYKLKVKKVKDRLVEAEGDKRFFACNGTVVADLLGLRDLVSKISDADFEHHVNDERNDFASWIESVLADEELAQRLRRIKIRSSYERAIEDYLREFYNIK